MVSARNRVPRPTLSPGLGLLFNRRSMTRLSLGHMGTQFPQLIQISASTDATSSFFSLMASTGHRSTQSPHPVQVSLSSTETKFDELRRFKFPISLIRFRKRRQQDHQLQMNWIPSTELLALGTQTSPPHVSRIDLHSFLVILSPNSHSSI